MQLCLNFSYLSLELRDVPNVDENMTHQLIYLYILPVHLLKFRVRPSRCTYFGAKLAFLAEIFLSIFFILDDPFPVLFFV